VKKANIYIGLMESSTKEIRNLKFMKHQNLDISSVQLQTEFSSFGNINMKIPQKKSFLTNAEQEQGNSQNLVIQRHNNNPILITNDIKSDRTKQETYAVYLILYI
jgi:hypothetical protein